MKEPFRIVILHFQLIQNLLSEVFKMLFRSKSSLFPGQQFENHSKATTQKGNAYLGLGQFDEAKECFELLRSFGEGSTADNYLKKVHASNWSMKKRGIIKLLLMRFYTQPTMLRMFHPIRKLS